MALLSRSPRKHGAVPFFLQLFPFYLMTSCVHWCKRCAALLHHIMQQSTASIPALHAIVVASMSHNLSQELSPQPTIKDHQYYSTMLTRGIKLVTPGAKRDAAATTATAHAAKTPAAETNGGANNQKPTIVVAVIKLVTPRRQERCSRQRCCGTRRQDSGR